MQHVWALPFFMVLAPSERYHQHWGKRHKKIPDWGRQLIYQLRRWLPSRTLVVVADSTYAVLELLAACQRLATPVTLVTRLRMDGALYDPLSPQPADRRGRPRVKDQRQPTLVERLADPQTRWGSVAPEWAKGAKRASGRKS